MTLRPMLAARLLMLPWVLSAALLAGCGQTGKLYLPEPSGEVVTRPASSEPPPVDPAPANSPQTVDSPPESDTPTEREEKKDKKN